MVSLLASFFGRVAVMPIQVPVAMLLTRPISTSPIIETGVKKPRWTGPPFPKRPSASFMLYYRKQFNELEAEEPNATELQKTASKVKKAAEQWKEMTSEEKKPYEDRAAEASAAYKEEMKEYLMKLNPQDMRKLKLFRTKMTRYRIAKKEMKEGVWVKPPAMVSGYSNFMRDQIVNKPTGTPITEWTKTVAQLWRDLPEQQKQDYKEKARDVYAAKKAAYKLELKEKENLKKTLVKKDVEEQQDAPPDLA